MKKLYAFGLALATLAPAAQLQAQTNDINLILSPTLGYTGWSKQVNFGSTAYWGARVGWSFGQNIEVYGTYDRTFDLQGKLREGRWNVLDKLADRMEGSNVQMERWGGEVKVNFLPNTLFTPYVLGGAGSMNIKHDALQAGESDYREEQLYAVLGAGAKFNVAQRLTLGLEVRNTLFNLDDDSHYRNTQSTSGSTLHNWSVAATLNAYLGGNNRARTPFEKAMSARYSGGLKGLVWVVEPSVAYINFNDNSKLHDQWFLGASAGVDFSPVLGVRGFYYTSTKEPSKLSLNLDQDLQLYGAQFIGRLNYLRGLTPYLSLGGGYMDVSKDYVGRNANNKLESGWFALAGAGLEMPIHRYASLFGSVSAMVSENENPDLDKAYRPSQVQANMMYQVGVRFRLGKAAKNAQQLYTQYATAELAAQRARELKVRENMRKDNEQKTEELIAFYDRRIAQLDSQLIAARETADETLAQRLEEERALLADTKSNINLVVVPQRAQAVDTAGVVPAARLVPAKKRETVLMTAAQLNTLIDRVITESRAKTAVAPVGLSDLDKILLFALVNNGHSVPASLLTTQGLQGAGQLTVSPQEIDALRKRIEQLEKELRAAQQNKANP